MFFSIGRLPRYYSPSCAIMGCSNPHPHGQVWSLSEVPTLPAKELASLARYASDPSSPSSPSAPRGPAGRPCLLCEYAHFEISVAENEGRQGWTGIDRIFFDRLGRISSTACTPKLSPSSLSQVMPGKSSRLRDTQEIQHSLRQ